MSDDPTETEMMNTLRDGAAALVGAGEIDAEEANAMVEWVGELS